MSTNNANYQTISAALRRRNEETAATERMQRDSYQSGRALAARLLASTDQTLRAEIMAAFTQVAAETTVSSLNPCNELTLPMVRHEVVKPTPNQAAPTRMLDI
jgi:hypothetical protein